MKKSKIILFTLLLSIMGVVGSIKAAGVNTLVKSNNLSSVTSHQLIQSSTSENVESEKNNKPILWTPKFQEFKKGDQVKILLPKGKYMGKTSSLKIVYNGKQIGILNLTNGRDYGIIIFSMDANSSEIARFVAGFGKIDFGSAEASGVIDIGGATGGCTGNTGNTASKAPVVDFSSSSNENGKVIIINPGPGPVIIPSSESSTSMSSLSSLSFSNENKGIHRYSSHSSSAVSSSQSKCVSTIVCSSSALGSLGAKSTKLSHKKSVLVQSRKQISKQSSQPDGNFHPNSQRVILKHELPKTAKEMKKDGVQSSWCPLTVESPPSKQGLTLKHRNAAHPVSNVHRVTLPIQGILPATRMDPYTWVYSLVGLTIMIVSGRAFFSKKRK